MTTDTGTGAVESFAVTIVAAGPLGINSTTYAMVTDTANGASVSVGPWSFSGNTTSFAATISGAELGQTSAGAPVSMGLKVALYNVAGQALDTLVPTGSPVTLEAPEAYLSGPSFICETTAEDGNCQTFDLTGYAVVPGSNPVTCKVKLIDLTSGNSVPLGPVTITPPYSYFSLPTSATAFGLATGQAAKNQQFETQLYDSISGQVLDAQPMVNLNMEGP
jgi:hypothetical protein